MFDIKNLHHAYVVEGDIDIGLQKINAFASDEMKVSLHGNPDIFFRTYEGFGINDAREIKEYLLQKPVSQYKLVIIALGSMTIQSGNALLKSLEEPPQGVHFFIAVPTTKRLIDTLLSRVVVIKLDENDNKASNNNEESLVGIEPQTFLTLTSEKRMDEVKKILSLYEKEKITKQHIISFLKEVIFEYKSKHSDKKTSTEALKNAITALDYANDTSSSIKIIMEYISLTLV